MKIKIMRRGLNSRHFRKLNSVTELVGKEVNVADEEMSVTAEVDEVKVDKNDDVTLTLDNGDEVVLDANEAEDLMEQGQAVTEDAPTEAIETEVVTEETNADEIEPEEFEVTREVVDEDGVANEVTTTVAAPDEGDAVKVVTMLDSKRGRNSRHFRVRKANSEEVVEPKNEPETKEFKVTRVADCDGKKVRKTASVTAPTLEEAIDAVKVKDNNDGIQADGYEELVEKLPESTVTINADVDEVIEEPETTETPEDPETTTTTTEEETAETTTENPETTETEEETEVIDRESNSFKGVAQFVRTKYGVTL